MKGNTFLVTLVISIHFEFSSVLFGFFPIHIEENTLQRFSNTCVKKKLRNGINAVETILYIW